MSTPFSSARVLLVEDNPLNQQLMQELLAEQGLRVDVATNGAEALSALEHGSYGLVLMDLQMPEMDGLEATRRIRAQSRFAHLPIVAMTANLMPEDRVECEQAGMNGFLTKPVDMAEVTAVLQRWLQPTAPAGAIDWNGSLQRLSGRADLLKRALRDFAGRDPSHAEEIVRLQAQGRLQDAQYLAHTLKGLAANLGMNRLMEAASHAERVLRGNTVVGAELVNELLEAAQEARAAAATLAA